MKYAAPETSGQSFSIPVVYYISPNFIKKLYCALIKNNKIKDIRAEMDELSELYDKGYSVDYGVEQIFIKDHIYDR